MMEADLDSKEAIPETLKLSNLGVLVEELHDARDKWRAFGLQLGIDDTTLKAIESEQRGDVDNCFCKTLSKWLSTCSHNCTIHKVIEALRSHTVGKFELAEKLKCSAGNLSGSKKRGRVSESAEIDLPPKRVCSEARSKFASYIESIYDTILLPTDEKYDLSSIKLFINLVCMSKTVSLSQDRELADHMVRGTVDEFICAQKSLINLADIAQKIGDRFCKLVLIEGAPGIGKTTLSYELCRGWSSGSLLTQYSLVILIKLRDRDIQQASTFNDLLKCVSEDCLDPPFESILKEVNKENGKGVLFILEGLDELPASIREDKNSVLMKLIRGRLLPACTVLVTTRSWAVNSLRTDYKSRIDQHIEIAGFTKENIFSFIDSVIEEEMRQSVYDYVNSNPHILSAMYNPLCARIVLCVYKEYSQVRGYSIPHTITELYKCYTNMILKGHTHIVDSTCTKSKLDYANLPQSMQVHYDRMCKMAHDGIMKEDQMLVFHVDKPEELETLGLMRCVQPLYRSVTECHQPSFHFLHFTLQEFMAAVHISRHYEPKDIVKMFKTSSHVRYVDNYMVLRFLAGLTKFQNSMLKGILPSSASTPRIRDVLLHPDYISFAEIESTKLFCNISFTTILITWLYESQNKLLFSTYKDQIIAFTTKCAKTAQEYFELGYCIAACGALINLEIDCCIECDRLQMLVAGLRSVAGSCQIQYLSIRDNQRLTFDTANRAKYEETLQSLVNELCPEHVKSPQASSGHSSGTVYFPSIPTLKELDLPNFIAWNISELNSLQRFTVTLSVAFKESESNDLQPSFCKLLDGNKSLSKLILKYPYSKSSSSNGDWFVNTSSYSAYEFNTEQLSCAHLVNFVKHKQLTNEMICAVESLKLSHAEVLCRCLDESDKDMKRTLSRCTNLCLYRTETALSELAVHKIFAQTAAPCFSLKHLTFDDSCDDDLSMVFCLLVRTSSLQTIELGLDSGLKEKDINIFMDFLRGNTSIKKLTIYIDRVRSLIEECNDSYHSLKITTMPSSEINCMFSSLGDIIRFCCVPACHLENESSLAIAKMLRENSTLEFFEMVYVTRDNGPRYIYPILDALRENATLKTLLLQKQTHSIKCHSPATLSSDEDASARGNDIVYDLLAKNQTLQALEVSLYPEHYPSLLRGLNANKVLEELRLPEKHETFITDCPEFMENAQRIQFTGTFEYFIID